MRPRNRLLRHAPAVLAALHAGSVAAQDAPGPWSARADFQGFFNAYEDSADRDTLTNIGVFVHADYFERAGFTVGYNRTRLEQGAGAADIDQDSFFLSGRYSVTPDALAGRLTLRLDLHSVANDDRAGAAGTGSSTGGSGGSGGGAGSGGSGGSGAGGSGAGSGGATGSGGSSATGVIGGTDDVTAAAVQIAYLNFAGTFYWDVGYTSSSYGDRRQDGKELEVEQLTPTVGFGFNERRDWIELRAYLIDASLPALALGEDETTALELKWTHWPLGGGWLGLDNFRISVMAGERLFAVDPDAGTLFNLADIQTGIASVGGEWAFGERDRLLVLLGTERYENAPLARDYSSRFVYLNFAHRWE